MPASIHALEIVAIIEGGPVDLLHLQLILQEDIKKEEAVVESFSPTQSDPWVNRVVVRCKKSITKHEAVTFFLKKSSTFPTLQIKMEMLNLDKKFIAVNKIKNNKIDSFSCVWDSPKNFDDFVITHDITEVATVDEKKSSSIEPNTSLPCLPLSSEDLKTLQMVKAFFVNLK